MNPVILYRIAYKYKDFTLLAKLITLLIRLIFGCYIPHTAKIGDNLIVGYGGIGVVIHSRAKIGDNCHIDQNVTIGGTSKKYDVPIIGNNVYIGAGAKVIGPIKIGNDVVIGANCVVINDIPDHSLVVGVPGRIVKKGIKKEDYV